MKEETVTCKECGGPTSSLRPDHVCSLCADWPKMEVETITLSVKDVEFLISLIENPPPLPDRLQKLFDKK